jgi:hypothetical protein
LLLRSQRHCAATSSRVRLFASSDVRDTVFTTQATTRGIWVTVGAMLLDHRRVGLFSR